MNQEFIKNADLIHRVVAYYRQKLTESPKALDYLKARGIVHPAVIDHFQIGYCDNTLHKILPAAKTPKGKEIRNHLKTLGLVDRKGQERFKGCLTVPVQNQHGEMIELYGRRAKDALPELKHLFLRDGKAGFFNLAAVEHKELILCGSVIDALSFWI
ncbi:DNA primase, partial [bacterium]|nr:DNA primase [bacterium]